MQNTTRKYSVAGNHVRLTALRTLSLAVLFLLAASLGSVSAFAQKAKAITAPAIAGIQKTDEPVINAAAAPIGTNVSETLIDGALPDDPDILKMLEPYRGPVRELDVVIGHLKGELRKGGVGAGSLGNFVTDSLRAEASRKLGKPVALMVANSGGMRKSSIAEGELRVSDIFELTPFENKLIRVDLTGEQVLRLLKAVVADRDAQSGAHITFRYAADNKPEFVKAGLIDQRGREYPIKARMIYQVITLDYLYNLKSGRYSILGESKNVLPVGVTLRAALLDYVRTETAKGRPIRAKMDNRFTQIGPTPSDIRPQ
ncbi:MAG TPA: 5'-nucleotidase C-terminal domain-containing protein [Pyrinomonadaceae bacterium]